MFVQGRGFGKLKGHRFIRGYGSMIEKGHLGIIVKDFNPAAFPVHMVHGVIGPAVGRNINIAGGRQGRSTQHQYQYQNQRFLHIYHLLPL